MVSADLVVTNARIYTGKSATPWAEAFACREGRIVKVGRRREVESLAGPGVRSVDADGRLVLPGFIDAHTHLIWGFELGSWIDLSDRPSLKEAQERLACYARENPKEAILLGHGFDYAALKADGIPGKEALDEVVSDRPVFFTAWDGHTGWGNSRFVERALDVMKGRWKEIGEMQLDPRSGKPTGIFERAFDLTPLLPEVQARRSVDGLLRTVSEASRLGITTAFDIQVNLEDLHAYAKLREAGGLTVRIRIALYHPETTRRDQYIAFEEGRAKFQDDWIRVDAIKLYIDGVAETGTAALLEPYANRPDSRGRTVYEPGKYRRIVAELDRRGFQVCTHACGDRGVRIALDAYEYAARANGTRGRRHRIEHCENLSPEDLPRFARLGVVPCMMPRHAAPELTTRWREAVGSGRADVSFLWRELLDAGATLAFASDWPVVSMNPLVGIGSAVSMTLAEGRPSPHRISVREAVDGYTRSAAFALHEEANRGTLAKGKYADFLVVSQDLFEIPPERIVETQVLQTFVDGRRVFPTGV